MYQPIFAFSDLLLIFTCFGCFFLSIVTCSTCEGSSAGKRSSKTAAYLIAFFLSVGVSMALKLVLWVPQLLVYRTQFDEVVSFLYVATCVLKGVALYLYTVSFTEVNHRVGVREKVLLSLPVIIAAIYVLLGLDTTHLTRQFEDTTPLIFGSVGVIVGIPWVFSLLCLSRLSKANHLLENYSSEDIHVVVNWLMTLVAAFIVTWSWELFTHFFSGLIARVTINDLPHYFGVIHDALSAVCIIFIYIYTSSKPFRSLNHARLFGEGDVKGALLFDEPSESKSHLSEAIIAAMLKQHLHLEKNLNIERFSEKLGYKTREVSHAINAETGKTFFEFINHFRIEHAKSLLTIRPNDSIADIMQASGFNSESSFYRTFKKHTGCSPSQYRVENVELAV